MNALLTIILIGFFFPRLGFTQDTVSGYYEYQTSATERIGRILDLQPDRSYIKYAIRYGETNPIDSGKWYVRGDSVILSSNDSLYYLKIESENNLRTFIPDSAKRDSTISWLIPTHWSKTRSYYQSGQIESVRSWSSISSFYHEFTPHGLWIYYYENGAIKAIGRYKKGKKKGKWFYLWPDGKEKN